MSPSYGAKMRCILVLKLILFILFSKLALGAASFGPRESKLIFEEKSMKAYYRIDNTDKNLPWLVQAWVEDASEKKTSLLTATPMVFRVEPSSVFTVRIVKTGYLAEDKETLFWAVSNSLPGGASTNQEKEEDKITAKLSLAYRFKVPLIYRPASLNNFKQEPEKLEWKYDAQNGLKLYNPTRYVVQLHNIVANGKKFQGKGVSFIISPKSDAKVKADIKRGTIIKYSIINDYGAVKEYEGVVK